MFSRREKYAFRDPYRCCRGMKFGQRSVPKNTVGADGHGVGGITRKLGYMLRL